MCDEWQLGKNSRDAYTTTYENFRVPVMERSADGSLHKVFKTVRRPVVSVQPDHVKAGGKFWEGD